ncbi:MAG: hypothetical protein KAS86_02975, partial [Candidatus Omnitrophica bacterium]|nr:hypothetical protein [Candidatus Omnitrophota bacterium]
MGKFKNNIMCRLISITVACLFLFNDASRAHGCFCENTLAVQSLFDHPDDQKLLKIAIVSELEMNKKILSGSSLIQTSADNQQILLGFHELRALEKSGGYIIPCAINGREYLAYVEKEKLQPEGDADDFNVHVYSAREMQKYLEHQKIKDTLLSDLTNEERVALSLNSVPITRILGFLKEIERALEIGDGTEEGPVTSQVSGFARSGSILKVRGFDDVPAGQIDHASNISIHVKDRNDPTELELAVLHEIFAKFGIPASVNDRGDVKSMVRREYILWKRNDKRFCPRKIRDKIAIASNWKIDLAKCKFVDMDTLRDRDYSSGEFEEGTDTPETEILPEDKKDPTILCRS